MRYNSSDLLPKPREQPIAPPYPGRPRSNDYIVWNMIRCDREYAIERPGTRKSNARPRNGSGEMEPEKKPTAVVDCIGLYCPMPITMTKEAIEHLAIGEVLMVEADDPAAEEDIRRWANRVGHEIVKFEKDAGVMRFSIRKVR